MKQFRSSILKILGLGRQMLNGPLRFGVVFGLVFGLLVGLWLSSSADAFEVESIGAEGSQGEMVVDLRGAVHACHHSNGGISYTTNASGFWETQEIVSDAGPVQGMSIVLDNRHFVHIVYCNPRGSGDDILQLVHITNATGTWQSEVIDDDVNVYFGGDHGYWSSERYGGYPELSIDSADQLHVSYQGSDEVRYARTCPDGWCITFIADNGGWAQWNAITLDADNRPYIVYSTEGDLMLAVQNSASYWDGMTFRRIYFWTYELVYESGIGSGDAYPHDIVVDNHGDVHIVFRVRGSVIYAVKRDGDWTFETVATSIVYDSPFRVYVGGTTAISIDSAGKVHIGTDFTFDLGGTYDFAQYFSRNSSGVWESEFVDFNYCSGVYCLYEDISIAVDSRCGVHFLYRRHAEGSEAFPLMHAYKRGYCLMSRPSR